LKLKWAFGFPGDIVAYGAPTVKGDALFIGAASGMVHALNTKTGCLYWTFQADGPVRSAPLVLENASGYSLLVGDQFGWFYAIDARTGKLIWKRRSEEHEATRLTGLRGVRCRRGVRSCRIVGGNTGTLSRLPLLYFSRKRLSSSRLRRFAGLEDLSG